MKDIFKVQNWKAYGWLCLLVCLFSSCLGDGEETIALEQGDSEVLVKGAWVVDQVQMYDLENHTYLSDLPEHELNRVVWVIEAEGQGYQMTGDGNRTQIAWVLSEDDDEISIAGGYYYLISLGKGKMVLEKEDTSPEGEDVIYRLVLIKTASPEQAEEFLEEKPVDIPQPEPEADGKEKPPDSGAPHASWKQIYRRARAILKDPNAAPEQTARAVELLMKAAEHGNCSAAFTLGQLYLSGTTLLRDPAAAVRWLERAALGGNQYAQYRLGKLLLQGEDVPKDADGAVRWLKASAEQGNQYAQYALGKLYLLGEEVPEDREAARQWFQQAAEQGNQYAQYFVEHMGRRDLFPVTQSVAQLLHHLAGIFREQSQPPRPRGLRLTVDKKLWRKIREKKIAMGHKPDDHEEPTITM